MAAGKSTPAGFRMPIVSSSYHEKCISASVKAIQEASTRSSASSDKTHPSSAYRDCNTVVQNKIWVENVHKELVAARSWDKTWGFMTEYDCKGNARQKKTLPEKDSFYRTAVPHTASKHVGSQLSSPHSKDMLRLEMTTCHRKKKTDLESYYS